MDYRTQVLAAEQAWRQAHLGGNLAQIDALMHSEYTRIQPNGSVWDKAQTLASYQNGQRKWFEITIDQLDIRIIGQVAVVIGRWQARGINQGQAFDYTARYTSVWVLEDSKWQMLSDQSTEIVDTT